jgi:hypothetical protein
MIQSNFMLLDMNKHWARRRTLEIGFSSRGQVIFADCLFIKRPERIFDHLDNSDTHAKRTTTYVYIVLASLYGHFDLALEVAEQSESPLDPQEKIIVREAIEKFTKFGPLVRLSSRAKFAAKIGWLVSHLAAKLQGSDRLFGWGSDLNTLEKRYRYLGNGVLVNLFRK